MIAEQLKEARERVKLTQKQAAKTIKISRDRLIRIEKGTGHVSISELDDLCDLYDISLISIPNAIIKADCRANA